MNSLETALCIFEKRVIIRSLQIILRKNKNEGKNSNIRFIHIPEAENKDVKFKVIKIIVEFSIVAYTERQKNKTINRMLKYASMMIFFYYYNFLILIPV